MGGILIARIAEDGAPPEIAFVEDAPAALHERINHFRRRQETRVWYAHREGLRRSGRQDDPNLQDHTGGMTTPLDPALLPGRLRLLSRGAVPDLCLSGGLLHVSPAFRAAVDAIDPDGVQWLPLLLVPEGDDHPPGLRRFFLNPLRVRDSLLEDADAFDPVDVSGTVPGLRRDRFPLVPRADARFRVRATGAPRAALWRELRARNYLFASDRLVTALTEARLGGWALSHRFDEV